VYKVEGKAWRGPQGSRRLRIPDFLHNRHEKMAGLSALRNGPGLYVVSVYFLVVGTSVIKRKERSEITLMRCLKVAAEFTLYDHKKDIREKTIYTFQIKLFWFVGLGGHNVD
jgi:hypothetical protein